MFDVRAYVLVVVVGLYLICTCLRCLLGEEDKDSDHKEDKDENEDTDLQEREADQDEANRTCVDEQLGPDLEFVERLLPSERERFVNYLDHVDTSPEFASMANEEPQRAPSVRKLETWCTFTSTTS